MVERTGSLDADGDARTRALESLLTGLERDGHDPHTLLVARHGRTVLSRSWHPYQLGAPILTYSVSKTFVALAIGFLVADGLVATADPVDGHLPLPNPHGITVQQLLTMTTGHSRDQLLGAPMDAATLLSTPPAHAPGTWFAYNSPASLALSELVTAVTDEPVGIFLEPRLFRPLAIERPFWRAARGGPSGPDEGYSGLHLSTEHLLRLAVLLAGDGRFAGEQIIDASWLEQMRRCWTSTASHASAESDYGMGYGYQLWRSRFGVRADGSFGQLAVAVPERGLALALTAGTTDQQGLIALVMRFVEALGDAATDLLARPEGEVVLPGNPIQLTQPVPSDDGQPVTKAPWLLRIADGNVRMVVGGQILDAGVGAWVASTLRMDGGIVPLQTLAVIHDDGTIRIDVIVANTPHRFIVTGLPGTKPNLAWVTRPLWNRTLEDLAIPEAFWRSATHPH